MTKNETPRVVVTEAVEWARKVAASKPPRYTDASRNAARYILDRTAAEAASRDRTATPIDIDALADELTSAANIVTNGGCYEIDTDAVARRLGEVFARFEAAEAASREEVERLREALQDVVSPLAYLQRYAKAEGRQISGQAYAIANDLAFVQDIARSALSAIDGEG